MRRAAAIVAAMLLAPPAEGQRAATVPAPAAPTPAAAARPTDAPPGMQYLYGSAEAAAASVAAWHGVVAWAAAAAARRPVDSVVLAEGATLAAPRWMPCGDKPLAAVFDVDETVLLNPGAEYDAAHHPGPFDPKRWLAWEREGAGLVVPVPGARDALAALRAMGVTVIFNTNRDAANAAFTEVALNGAGVGPAVHGQTLYLKGDDATGPAKDGRRRRIAERYCVVAMAGDQLGDFSDRFNAPHETVAARRAAAEGPIAARWGAGWFVLPNPVYGTAIRGTLDEVFPPAERWSPAGERR